MNSTAIFSLVVCGGIPALAILVFIFATPSLSRSRLTTRIFVNNAYKEIRCPSCTYGAQYIHPTKGRIPIPIHLRMVRRDRPWDVGSPQANIDRCIDCGGNGWTATKIPDAEDEGYKEVT